ncbi:adenylyl-sulfate kinase [Cohnella candidum]|uniref:Adenylyl-sulfate kinase n=1 Tax=Cohnella candidum TaxID=2674991 RepID=A0A3G3K6L9_9BACL|nr:adenylyl-sulfate kinase [Cohnella candidum]AYQ75707.1 adenylyl-sulfate kinase [Cohnella candidum]
MNINANNVKRQSYRVTKEMRRTINKHKSFVIWLTGLSGSGKSTIADALDLLLFKKEMKSYVLDGDNVRLGLNKNLGFSAEDRKENIRRVGEVSKLFVDSGVICISAFISPFLQDRKEVRALFEEGEFIEVYVKCPLETCELRDPKGLYEKARKGEIKDFTGISSPYEVSENPELIIETDLLTIEESVNKIYLFLESRGIVNND